MAYFSENLTILVAKVETVPGTMETLTAADFNAKVFNPTVTMTVEPDDEAAKYANGNHGEDVSVMGIQHGTISFTIKMARAEASLSTPPTWEKFALGAGLVVDNGAGVRWALHPLKAGDEKTLTIWVYKIQRGASPRATIFKYAGCMGTLSIGGEGTGKPMAMNFSFMGKLVDVEFNVVDSAIPEINSADDTCYERMMGTTFTIDGVERQVESATLDTGNEISMLKSMTEDTGISFFGITKRAPRLTINPLMINYTGAQVTDYDYYYGSTTGCPATPAIVWKTQNFTITMPKCQLTALAAGNRDGLASFDQTWRVLGNGYTANLADVNLPAEATFEIYQGDRQV
jgi:hypothetical protein